MSGEIQLIFVFVIILPLIMRIGFYLFAKKVSPRRKEDKDYQKIEDELKRTVSTQPSGFRLMNIVEVMYRYRPDFGMSSYIPLGSYDIKDENRKVTGHVYRQILHENCGGELEGGLKHCRSCGADAIVSLKHYVKYIFEGTDGIYQGEIRDAYNIFDFQKHLLATIKPSREGFRSIDLRGYAYGIYDPQGRVLGEYHGDREGDDYQILTSTRSVVANVHLEPASNEYYVYVSPENFNTFLVLSYVVLMDMRKRVLAIESASASSSSS